MTMTIKFWQNPDSGHWLAKTLEGLIVVSKDVADSEESAGRYAEKNKGSLLKGASGTSLLFGFQSASKAVEFADNTVFKVEEESIPSIKLKIL